MTDIKKTKEQLNAEIKELHIRNSQLEDINEQYRQLFENESDAVMIFDAETLQFEDANRATLELYGYSKEEFLSKAVLDISNEKEKTRLAVKNMIHNISQNKKIPIRYFRKKDGTVFPGEVYAGSFISKGKKKIVGTVRDITDRLAIEEELKGHRERLEELVEKRTLKVKEINKKLRKEIEVHKKTQEELKKSETRLRVVVEDTPGMICRFLSDGTLTYVNNNYCKYFSKNCKDLIGQNFFQFLLNEDQETIKKHYMSLNDKKPIVTYEHKVLMPDGTIRWQQWTDRAIFNEHGKVIEYQSFGIDITEKKRAEKLLSESEEMFRSLAEKSPNMIFINKKGRVVFASEKCEEIMGYSKKEFYSEDFNFINLVRPEHKQLVMESFSRHLRGEEVEPYEYSLITKKGKYLNTIITTKLIDYESEKAILGIVTDITELKTAEKALKRRLEFEKTISALSARFVGVFDIDDAINKSLNDIGVFGEANCSYLSLLSDDGQAFNISHEWCENEVYGQSKNLNSLPVKNYSWFIKKLEREQTIHIKDVSKLPQSVNYEKKIFKKQGIQSMIVLPFKVGGSLSGFIGLANYNRTGPWKDDDILLLQIFSQILSTVFEQKKAVQALMESDRRNEALLKAVPDMTFVINRDGTYVDVKVGRKTELIFSTEKIVGKNVRDLPFPDKDGNFMLIGIEEALSSGEVQTLEHELETSKGLASYEVRLAPLNKNEVIANVRNISERKRLEEELLKSEKLESLGILAGGLAHDFNNLLTAIVGNISVAKTYENSWSQVVERLEAAEKASLRARDLTQQLLTFSMGGLPVKKVISISQLLKDAVSFSLSGTNVRYAFDIPEDLSMIEVDEGQINQAIHNIVINAVQAMPKGGQLKISCRNNYIKKKDPIPLKEGNYVKVLIQDQGIGISETYLHRIFDPYFTTKQKGSGLGLATTYSIIKKHEGYIFCKSEMDIGTTFHIYLPAGEKESKTKKIEKNIQDSGTGKVLLMDDESIVREIAGDMLKTLGYEVEFASDGAMALKLYKKAKREEKPFKLVILDLTVPGGIGGNETIEKLLKLDPDVRTIVSSGYSTDPVMANYDKYGFIDVITKPYRIQELNEVINRVMRNFDEK